MDLVIGIPAYNEEKNIAGIMLKLRKITKNIIVCNDGSSDLTGQIASELGAVVINHQKNLGYGAAIKSIFLKAKELEAEILVTFDADGQHRVKDIPLVIKPIEEKKSDIVIGSRFLSDVSDKVPEYRKFGIKVITKVTNASIHEKLTDSQSGFRSYSKKVLSEVTPSDRGMGVSTELLIKANSKGFKISEVPIKILYEGESSTSHPVSHGASVLFSTIKFTSIEHPLKFYGIPGVITTIIGLFFMVWTVQEFSQFGNFPPIPALISIGFILVGMILLIAAVILYSLISVVRERRD